MEIIYRNAKLKTLCEDYRKAKKYLNIEVAEKLFKAINYITNADAIIDIVNYPPFKFHGLKGE